MDSSNSSNYKNRNVPNVLKYSSSVNTKIRHSEMMKSVFLAKSSITVPTSSSSFFAFNQQPLKSQVDRTAGSFTTSPINLTVIKSPQITAQPISIKPQVERNVSSVTASSKPMIVKWPPTSIPTNNLELIKLDPPSTNWLSRVSSIFSSMPSPKGYAIIFNHEKFKSIKKPNRTGTHRDVNDLKSAFNMFHIKTKVKNNLTLDQIKKKVQHLQQADFSKYQCFIIVILTHGDHNQNLYAADAKYEFNDIIEDPILKSNKTLLGKPKIFITNVTWDETTNVSMQTDTGPNQVAIKRDIFKCSATHYHQTILQGTAFVQTLCRHMKIKGKYDELYNLMMSVTSEISNGPDVMPDIPKIQSTMTKPFCFGQLQNVK